MKDYKIDIWLNLGKIAFALGSLIVLSSYFYSSIEGYVSGFKWMAFGSFFIFFDTSFLLNHFYKYLFFLPLSILVFFLFV